MAGCTAARLFGLPGARVALIDRRPDPAAYKVACTHAILSSGSPTIERLGLAPLLRSAEGSGSRARRGPPYSGWDRGAQGRAARLLDLRVAMRVALDAARPAR